MKKFLVVLMVLMIALPSVTVATADTQSKVVNVFNWEDYICEEALQLFEEETGIKVNYMRFTTNEDMMVQLRANPSAFDVVFPSDYCIERLIAEDLLEPIDFANVPNIEHIVEWLRTPDYDPTGEYSVPYMWGTVGILYNTDMVDEPVTSWSILWDAKYQNEVFMMDSIRDTMGVALKMLGYSMNTRDVSALEAAKDKLIEQRALGTVKAYQVDETKDKMVANEAAFGLMWSGDAAYAMSLNESLAYVVPDEGSNVWVDGMVIPKGAKNKENAEIFINFMTRPDIAAMNTEEIWYSCPNMAAIELLGEDYEENEAINPPQEVIDRCEFFHDIHDFMAVYNALWLEVKSAK